MSDRDERSDEAAADRFRRGLSFVDEAFERARQADGTCVPCRRGCSRCCESAAVFDLREADALLLRAWWRRQPEPSRREATERAREVVDAVAAAARRLAAAGESTLRDWRPGDGLDALPPPVATRLAAEVDRPCPLLGPEGECRAHGDRPSACRLAGVPWRDPVSGGQLPDACRLEPGMEANEPQELDLGRLDGLRHDVDEAFRAAGGRPRRRFVAQVLVEVEAASERP